MSVVDTALSLVGKVSYKFGADNIEGGVGDCSSFTQYVYKQNGVDIGRDTTTQLSNVTRVAMDDLQPGDLVFFQGTYRSGVSHVGVYIGAGQFIHNSSNGGTKISNLSSAYYQNHWLTGGRVSGVDGGTYSPDTLNTAVENTGFKSSIFGIMKNVGVILLIVLCVIGALVFFLGAWDIEINPLK